MASVAIDRKWDAKADLAIGGYQSPRPNLATLGKLQLNVWGTPDGGDRLSSYAVLFFDPADPTKIVGGSVWNLINSFANGTGNVVPGGLQDNTLTSAPGDFTLEFTAQNLFSNGATFSQARVAIDVLADGTVDVRGVSEAWAGLSGGFVVEGTGNTKFVVPAP